MDGGDGVSINVDREGNREIRVNTEVEEPEAEFPVDEFDDDIEETTEVEAKEPEEEYDTVESEGDEDDDYELDQDIASKVEEQLRVNMAKPRTLLDLEEEENEKVQERHPEPKPKNRIDPKNVRFERSEKREEKPSVNKIRYNNKGNQPKEREQRPQQQPQQSSIFRSGGRRNPMVDNDANNEMGEIFNSILRRR